MAEVKNNQTPIESGRELSDLIEGDWVIYSSGRSNHCLYAVSRTTNTQIIVEIANLAGQYYERKFYKKDGREIGKNHSWYANTITPFTVIAWERIILQRKYNKLSERLPKITSDETIVNEVYDFLLSKKLITPIETT